MEIWVFLGLVGSYWQFIKGFAYTVQPLHEHLSKEGTNKKNEWVMLMEEVLGAFEMLRKACLKAPVLPFANFNKPFLLETDASKLGMGAVLSQKQTDGQYHPVAYPSQSLTVHECNYHSTKQGVFSTEVGDCGAVSGLPTLETIQCQNQQQSAHLHHDST